jgi:hypothetical protein
MQSRREDATAPTVPSGKRAACRVCITVSKLIRANQYCRVEQPMSIEIPRRLVEIAFKSYQFSNEVLSQGSLFLNSGGDNQ